MKFNPSSIFHSPTLHILLLLFLGQSPWVATKSSAAADYAEGRNVNTLLVSNWAESENNSFYVAVYFEINHGWHTYWTNPGTTGMATDVNWILPEGLKIDAVYESPPHLYNNEGLIDYTHEESALVVAKVTAKNGTISDFEGATIEARVEWLECATLCVPGSSNLTTTLSENSKFDTSLSQSISTLVSSFDSVIAGTFQTTQDTVTFQFTNADEELDSLKSAYFFPSKPVNDAAAEQTFSSAKNTLTLITQPYPYEATDTETLSGWLYLESLKGTGKYYWATLSKGAIAISNDSSHTLSKTSGNLFMLLLLAFSGGMILNLMPCVFPVIGLKIMGFVEQAGQDRRKIMLHGLVFTSGVLVSFWVLSSMLLLLRAGGEQLGWGFQLQEPWFNYGLILLMLAFALSLNGVFEFGMSAIGVGSGLQRQSGVAGSFFSGVLATVVATPCSAPFLAPALGAALALNPVQAMLLFTCIALGLSTPYLLLSAFPVVLKWLPKPGAWMETFKQFMAFPLYGTVAYLLWALLGQIDDANQLNLLLSLALFAMAFWIYGRWAAPHRRKTVRTWAITAALVMILSSIWLGHPKQKKEFWEPWSPEVVERYIEEGRTVYVDFTARWCATCQLNKRVVFGSKEVLDAFEKHDVVALKADWTNRDERITQRLKSLGKAAVPVNLVYKKGEDEPVILPEVLTPGIVLQAISE